jgi:hydrogenase nickel incorporation protein HypA/HybF
MAIAVELLGQLEALAAEHGVEAYEEIGVEAGALRGIVPEALDAAFSALAEGTCAEGATLALAIVPVLARCRACGGEFAPAVDSYLCPACGRADAEILAGDDIILKTVTGRQAEGGEAT